MASVRSDVEMRQDVLDALARVTGVGARQIAVDVADGVVTLRGSVGSDDEKHAAMELARQVRGVADVRNLLSVLAPGDPPNRTDEEIAREVHADLTRNLCLPYDLQVDARGGTIFLRGFVRSQEQKWLADEVAWWTAGVRDVVNELGVRADVPEPPGAL